MSNTYRPEKLIRFHAYSLSSVVKSIKWLQVWWPNSTCLKYQQQTKTQWEGNKTNKLQKTMFKQTTEHSKDKLISSIQLLVLLNTDLIDTHFKITFQYYNSAYESSSWTYSCYLS